MRHCFIGHTKSKKLAALLFSSNVFHNNRQTEWNSITHWFSVQIQSQSRYIAAHALAPSSYALILALMGKWAQWAWVVWISCSVFHGVFLFLNFIPPKIWREPVILRCGEVKYQSIQPTWNIHPCMLKWARAHGRRFILLVAVCQSSVKGEMFLIFPLLKKNWQAVRLYRNN